MINFVINILKLCSLCCLVVFILFSVDLELFSQPTVSLFAEDMFLSDSSDIKVSSGAAVGITEPITSGNSVLRYSHGNFSIGLESYF